MILSKLKLVENIVNEISDNSTGQISPYDIRHNLLDIIDSVHLLTIGKPLSGFNFGTPSTRTTKAGDFTLEKLGLEGYFSIDNSAFGYSALKSNYQGIRNTALGSEALSCNIYGDDNVAVGASALGGNTIGIGNIGVGNYSLVNQKSGNYNVAIGYAAGYYADKNTHNKLFIASHANIDSEYMCDNPLGSGLTPLVYGDFEQLKFGIGVRELNEGTLQVGGDVVPSPSGNLGSVNTPWQNTFTDSVYLNDVNLYIDRANSGHLFSSGDIFPALHNTFDLGASGYRWNGAWLNDVNIAGIATINKLVAHQRCEYACKTISLATNKSSSILDGGGPSSAFEYEFQDELNQDCGTLTDEELEGAGFDITSSGVGYFRKYSFTFSKPNQSLSCLQTDNPYSRASWNSNISLHLSSGTHLRTDRILFPQNISLAASGCYGIFSLNNKLFVSRENVLRGGIPSPVSSSGYLAGVGDINFYANSGDFNNYIFNVAALESGVSVKQRFLTGVKRRVKDVANSNKDRLSGFEIDYIDDSLSNILGEKTDRLVIGSYDNTSEIINGVTLMKNTLDDGILGITNLTPISKYITPETAINARSIGNSVLRMTAENQSNTKAAVQLLGKTNCEENGLELAYYTVSGVGDLSMFRDSGKSTNMRFFANTSTTNPRVSFFPDANDTTGNSMINIGSIRYPYASIRMFHYVNDRNLTSPTYFSSGCVLFIKPKIAPFQAHTIYAIDGSGNQHDLIVNKFDSVDGRALYTDGLGNTYGGNECIKTRSLSTPRNNTALGFRAGKEITTASGNTIVGSNAGTNLTTGLRNIFLGHNVASGTANLNNNIIIGNDCFNQVSNNTNNNIIIGNDGIGNSINSNYNFIVGSRSGIVLMQGILGPYNSDKNLTLPSGGKIFINNSSDSESLSLRPNIIETIDYGGSDYPENELSFTFKGNNTATLLKLNHVANPLSNPVSYATPSPLRPYAELNGDLRLRGHIRFSDQTSLNSANFLNNINVLESGLVVTNSGLNNLSNRVASLIVEGFVPQEIKSPVNGSVPTTGTLSIKNKVWGDVGNVTLYNRDTTSTIHAGAYVIAIRVNEEYKPIWISASDTACQCC